MTCHDIELLLYDRLTGRAAPDVCRAVDAHLQHCARCQTAFEEMQRTVSQLDAWTVPDPSPDFQARLQARVTAHLQATPIRAAPPTEPVAAPPIPAARPGRRTPTVLFRRQWFPLVGLALAATLAGIVVVYQGFGPGDQPPKQMTRGLQLDFAGTPIVIETSDLDRALADLIAMVHSQGGEFLRKQPVASGLELTIKLAQPGDQALLSELGRLGRISVPKDGYRDGAGNVLMLLKQAGTFPPQRRPMGERSNGDG